MARTGLRVAFRRAILLIAAACGTASAQTPGDDLARMALGVPGRLGVYAMVLETGATLEHDADGRYPMQSVYKFPIAMAVLRQVDRRAMSLADRITVTAADIGQPWQHSPVRDNFARVKTYTVAELLRLMVAESDGTACDVLLRLLGGPEKVTAYLRELGIAEVIVATTEAAMGKDEQLQYHNWSTPKGMVALLRAFHEGKGLTPASRDLLRKLMMETATGPRRIKAGLPPGTVVAHKTGTARTVGKLARATNDVGIVDLPGGRHMAIAVFVADSSADTAAREQFIAQSARLAWDTLTAVRAENPPE